MRDRLGQVAATRADREPRIRTVAIDCTPLIGQTGGVGTFVRGAVGALAARDDVAVRAYALSWRGRRLFNLVLPAGVDVCRRPMAAGLLMSSWRRARVPPVEWWTGEVDAVHGTNFVVPPARRAAAIVTVHDLTAVRYPELCTPTTLRYPELVRRAVARGAFVHTPSQFVAAEVVEALSVPRERVRVVYHGVDRQPAPGSSDVAEPYIIAVGTVEPRKDLPGLVRAFDLLAGERPELRLVVAGEDGWGADAFAAAVATARYRDRILRRRGVDDAMRARLIAGAAVLAYPSVYEGFGLPPLEAMALGTPVVASRAGAVPEAVGDAAVLVAPGDDGELAAALAGVVDDTGRASALVERGREHVAGFTWERCASELVALYADAAGARR